MMEERNISKTRFNTGLSILVLGFCSPLFIPLVVKSGMDASWKTAISGLLAFGLPEGFMLVGIAVLGKDGYELVKNLAKRILRDLVPDKVTRLRYNVGLLMFVIPVMMGWLAPYIFFDISFYQSNRLALNVVGDGIFLLSFFILGGAFWDKFRALFVRRATAHL